MKKCNMQIPTYTLEYIIEKLSMKKAFATSLHCLKRQEIGTWDRIAKSFG